MNKKITRFLIGFLISILVIALLVASCIYFSVDNRIEIETSVTDFRNNTTILRLDTTTLTPDSVTS